MNEAHLAQQLRGSFSESVLLTLAENGGAMTHDVLDAYTRDKMASLEVLKDLHARGLIQEPDTAGVRISPFGDRTAGKIRQSLLLGQRRDDLVQRALLTWLADPTTQAGEVLDLLKQGPTPMGIPITEVEVIEAAELLADRGFIKVLPTAQAVGLRPRITPDGRTALHSDVLISEYGRPNATVTNYDYSNRINLGDHNTTGAVMVGGQGNTQHVSLTLSNVQRDQLTATFAEMLHLIDQIPDDGGQLREAVLALQQETEASTPRKELVSQLVAKALGAGVTAASTSVGQQFLTLLAQAAQLLN